MAEARIRVRVQPNASRDEIGCFEKGLLKIWVTAPPRKGEANDALVALLAKKLKVGRGRISILKGARAREKAIGVEGLSLDEIEKRLRAS